MNEKKRAGRILNFRLSQLALVTDCAFAAAAPAAFAPTIGDHGGEQVGLVSMSLHQQDEEAVLPDDQPGEVEDILHRARIAVGVALDGYQVGAIGQLRIRLPPKLDVFVRRIRRARWIE